MLLPTTTFKINTLSKIRTINDNNYNGNNRRMGSQVFYIEESLKIKVIER